MLEASEEMYFWLITNIQPLGCVTAISDTKVKLKKHSIVEVPRKTQGIIWNNSTEQSCLVYTCVYGLQLGRNQLARNVLS